MNGYSEHRRRHIYHYQYFFFPRKYFAMLETGKCAFTSLVFPTLIPTFYSHANVGCWGTLTHSYHPAQWLSFPPCILSYFRCMLFAYNQWRSSARHFFWGIDAHSFPLDKSKQTGAIVVWRWTVPGPTIEEKSSRNRLWIDEDKLPSEIFEDVETHQVFTYWMQYYICFWTWTKYNNFFWVDHNRVSQLRVIRPQKWERACVTFMPNRVLLYCTLNI